MAIYNKLNIKDISFICEVLLRGHEIVESNNEFYIYRGMYEQDIALPKSIKKLIIYDILQPFTGNLDTGDVSYILLDKKNLKSKLVDIKSLHVNNIDNEFLNFNKSEFLPALREYQLSKLDI